VRIGISLLTFAPDDLGGSETYAVQLVRALGRVGALEYVVVVPTSSRELVDGLPVVEVDEPAAGARGPSRIPLMALSARRTRAVGDELSVVDAVHYPLTVPIPGTDAPTVVTLHDIQHRDLPEFFGRARKSFRRIAYDRAAQAASAVVVTSEFVRRRAVDVLELDPDRVHVVPLGIDHSVFSPTGDEEPEALIVYPARPWPHKNHARLLEAFAALRETRPKLRLVLTGGGHERLGTLPEGVESLGVVTTSELASLYRRAACLVFPSLYEGFGLPPLEAMACGCPVAASRAGAIPEVCGDAAVLFDPTSVEDIARAVVDADTQRETFRERGLARAAEFTWDETARRHDAVYREAAAVSVKLSDTPTTS
jgi:glycosyltransferase involved in cell wall biosynthesis